ncbi:hypothetical protein N9Z44_02300 [Mariniblastus sp.]|nr:hypothetical protein [Mariniblastus sp.]
MFIRSILVPSLIACAIAAPVILNQTDSNQPDIEGAVNASGEVVTGATAYAAANNPPVLRRTDGVNSRSFLAMDAKNSQTAPIGNPAFQGIERLGNPAITTAVSTNRSRGNSPPSYLPKATVSNSGVVANQIGRTVVDYGSTGALIYPGNAQGPDYDAAPLEFMPVFNFEEVFRFDISENWVRDRWNRISTNAEAVGLHGLRVALVTGTSASDLHGSLTYYFDQNHRPQRITFRGWAGDGIKLTEFLTKFYGFRRQPTHWAGFYLSENGRSQMGGILMQYPTVIYRENQIQQVAVVMEINNPNGNIGLSQEFQSLIAGSQANR